MSYEEQQDLLQRYFDGDVSEQERAQVQARLASDASAREELEGLQAMRTQLKTARDQWQSGLDSDALFARIEEQIGHQRAPTERLRVIGGGGNVRSITQRKVVRWTAFAVAAALALGWLSWELIPSSRATIAKSSEILKVDFGNSAGKVIPTEDDQGKPVIVVWIEDDEKSF